MAVQYNQRFPNTPDNKAGASERAGFIEAPDINAKKKISNPTIPPIANPPNPFKPFVYTTIKITAISKAEAKPLLQILMVKDKHNLENLHQEMPVFL